MLANPQEWLIECHPIPGLPDPTGRSPTGVGGLLISVHGKFDEFEEPAGNKVHTRSFDRTFVLGPGGGIGGLRVINDMLCLRAFGGSQAWIPEVEQAAVQSAIPLTIPPTIPPTLKPAIQPSNPPQKQSQKVHPQAENGYGMPAPGKAEEQVRKEQIILETSFRTKMTLEFSELALAGNNWDLDAALKNFEELKVSKRCLWILFGLGMVDPEIPLLQIQGKLPANAFLPGV
jgi:nuclear RNA export factor